MDLQSNSFAGASASVLNLERLATVVGVSDRAGASWAIPDTVLGTDSHTPMVNGIGVLGWGVGPDEVYFVPVTSS